MPTPNRSGFKVPRSGFSIGRYADKIGQEQYPVHGFHRTCRSSSYWKRSKFTAQREPAYSAVCNDSGEVDAFKAESDANEMPQKRRSARYAQANAQSNNSIGLDAENKNAPLAQGTAARLNSTDRGCTD